MSWIDGGELSPELQTAVAAMLVRWEALRRSTARADRERAEAGIVLAYDAAGLAPPKNVVWCASPIELAACRHECRQGPEPGASVKSAVVDAIVRSVARAVELTTSRTFRSRLWGEARLTAASPISRGVQEALHAAVRRSDLQTKAFRPRDILQWLQRRQPRRRQLPFEASAFTVHDAPPLGIYEVLHDVGGLAGETAPLRGLWQIAASVGWLVPHETVCWVSDRPDLLKADDQGRLHATDGPALSFTDGWSYHAWKGVHVPAWMIEHKQRVTTDLVNRERDPVLRRCMIDIMTPARFISSSDAVCISRDETGMLWVKTWQHWDSWAAVEVVNGTPEPDGSFRQYVLQVPPTMRTAREAVAWTYGLSEQEYSRLRLRT